jgi:hypothetical protein
MEYKLKKFYNLQAGQSFTKIVNLTIPYDPYVDVLSSG